MNSLLTYNESYAGMAKSGKRTGFRIQHRKVCGFNSLYPHHKMKGIKNMPPRKREPKKLSDRDLINLYFDNKVAVENIRNSMGCDESWYDKHYAISRTFTKEQVNAMSDNELANLLKLAETIQEALY